MKRIAIVGAGVIGLSLAHDLSALGFEVDVFDGKKSVEEGAEKASGILSKKGLELSGLEYSSAIVNTLNGATLHFGDETLRVKSAAVQAYILDRGILAKNCAAMAIGAGAVLKLGTRQDIAAIRRLADEYDVVVGADGATSYTASAYGFPAIGSYVLTYKAEYSGAEIKDWHSVDLLFSKKFADGFFGWVAPYSKELVELGIGIMQNRGMHSYAAFQKFLADTYVSTLLNGARRLAGHASIIPIENRRRTVLKNVLLVGDAAGQTKATTGGGIIFGIACAKVAAHDINAYLANGVSLARYEKNWRKRYGIDLKLHGMLHAYYSAVSEHSMQRFIKVAKVLGAESFFSKYGDMDSPTLMLKRFFVRSKAS
ncbi:NAD(P)/FAD-dependent oxidoreductase [Candidatus Marsarchaeota archaeon]|nr:NAD(P)/FAD-dependent oxidoreductase [Candidatus Marsarchaeota archaeon]MCL5404776.1 NAD(P)/FAD-dependent oxidoreductase [Candidatus Marsarchaeota archaeon]